MRANLVRKCYSVGIDASKRGGSGVWLWHIASISPIARLDRDGLNAGSMSPAVGFDQRTRLDGWVAHPGRRQCGQYRNSSLQTQARIPPQQRPVSLIERGSLAERGVM